MFHSNKFLSEELEEGSIGDFIAQTVILLLMFGILWALFQWVFVFDNLTTAYYIDDADLAPVSQGISTTGSQDEFSVVLGIETVQAVTYAASIMSLVIFGMQIGLGIVITNSSGWIRGKRDSHFKDAFRQLRSGRLSFKDLNHNFILAVFGWLLFWLVDGFTDIAWKLQDVDSLSQLTMPQIIIFCVFVGFYVTGEAMFILLIKVVISTLVAQIRLGRSIFPGIRGLATVIPSREQVDRHNKKTGRKQQGQNKKRPRKREPRQQPNQQPTTQTFFEEQTWGGTLDDAGIPFGIGGSERSEPRQAARRYDRQKPPRDR